MKVLYFSDNTSGHNQRFLESFRRRGLRSGFSTLPVTAWRKAGCRRECIGFSQTESSARIRTRRRLPIFARVPALLQEIRSGPSPCRPDPKLWLPDRALGLSSLAADFLGVGSSVSGGAEPGVEAAAQIALSSADGFFCDCESVRTCAKQWVDIAGLAHRAVSLGHQKGILWTGWRFAFGEELEREPGTYLFPLHPILGATLWHRHSPESI